MGVRLEEHKSSGSHLYEPEAEGETAELPAPLTGLANRQSWTEAPHRTRWTAVNIRPLDSVRDPLGRSRSRQGQQPQPGSARLNLFRLT